MKQRETRENSPQWCFISQFTYHNLNILPTAADQFQGLMYVQKSTLQLWLFAPFLGRIFSVINPDIGG
jgi:hypothetical protein